MAFLRNLLVLLCCLGVSLAEMRPTVMWHGLGDDCCNPNTMGHIKDLIETACPGVFVYSVMVGDNVIEDTENGVYGNVNDQIQEQCDYIKTVPELANGFDAMGFSQGSQFVRGLAQRCPDPPVHNLISIGGQMQGVFGFPDCPQGNLICEEIRRTLSRGAYIPTIQNNLVQAQYWHDSRHEDDYRNGSIFIGEINNEVVINQEYKDNLFKLNNFIMVKFLQDTVVIPQESEWFGFYTPGQDKEVQMLNETRLWIEDRLGLQAMQAAGKLTFMTYDDGHVRFTDQWFIDEIIKPFLCGTDFP